MYHVHLVYISCYIPYMFCYICCYLEIGDLKLCQLEVDKSALRLPWYSDSSIVKPILR